jgi:hypothetical protein
MKKLIGEDDGAIEVQAEAAMAISEMAMGRRSVGFMGCLSLGLISMGREEIEPSCAQTQIGTRCTF